MTIEGILAIVFGITTVIGIIVTVKLSKKKQPFWSSSTEPVLRINPDAPKGLKLTFNDSPIDNLYRTKLIFFNKGNDPIEPTNIKEKVVISLGKARILSEPDYKPNRPVIKFGVKKVTTGAHEGIELDFSFLDQDDGALIEVLHAEKASIDKVGGVISGAKIRRIKEFQPPKEKSFLAHYGKFNSIIVVLGFIAYTLMISLVSGFVWWSWVIVDVILWFVFGLLVLRSYRNFTLFPKWARGQATSIAKADSVVGKDTEK
jgi:hypothetical protein